MRKDRANRGVYALVINAPKAASIRVGSLGLLVFKKGYYVYAGSALNSLRGRVDRHFRKDKHVHWHIDYLTCDSRLELLEAWGSLTGRRVECTRSKVIQEHAIESTKRFGSGDCECYSHLHRFTSLEEAQRTLSRVGFKLERTRPSDRAASALCRLQG